MIRYYLLLVGIGFIFSLQAQTNRALVVAIGQYPRHSGWERIHADNDGGLVRQMLLSHQYFPQHITILSNAAATKSSFEKAISQLCHTTRTGDYIYLHFSCHGQQMMDDNEDEEDGLDESIVLYDAGFWYMKGKYEGENHLRDDELGRWIDKLRKKTGETGQVVVVIDACHSGTANRENDATDYVRGTSSVFAPEGFIPTPGEHLERSLRLVTKPGFSPAVVWSACLPGEINYEYYDKQQSTYFGRLTFFFCDTVKEMDAGIGIKDFMHKLKLKVWRQTFYMECTSQNMIMNIGGRNKK